jgi:glycosyltransferase involved in cell wall biosynthesis
VAGTRLLQERVLLAESIPRDRIPQLLRSADALVSATVARDSETLDKVICEAAACAVPVLSANTLLAELLGNLPLRLVFRAGDADDLADAVRDLAAAPVDVRRATGRQLRERVVARHSVDFWADAVYATVAGQTAK